MYGNVNMFTARKVKLHGMTSSQWTTKDKITQYKGLISLYTRDGKIMETDLAVNKKKMQREIKDLAKKVYTDRRELDNAIRGDKQKLRNQLSDYRELQLAYQNSQPKKVLEEIDQLNFNRRKVLDRLKYDKKIKSQNLIDLKLESSFLEDRLKYESLRQIKQESEAKVITGKVQDAVLRTEAAAVINQIYKEILEIMKKDSLYFDVIIATVRNDAYAQSRCFLGATTLGQLATEYLDDRRQEYNTLEAIILRDMAARQADIRTWTENVERSSDDLKLLLRRDSDITACKIETKDSFSMIKLNRELAEADKTLNFLKETTLVQNYEAIFPCLQEQLKQRKRLKYLAKKCDRDRETLLNKTNHAELMSSVLTTSGQEELAEFEAQKNELLKKIEKWKADEEKLNRKIAKKHNMAHILRRFFSALLLLSYNVKFPIKKMSVTNPLHMNIAQTEPKFELPKVDEIDGVKIASEVIQKVTLLMTTYFSKYAKQDTAESALQKYQQFEVMMQGRQIPAMDKDNTLSTTSLLQGLFNEPSHQLTREDIKKISAEIVAANTKNDDLVPVFTASKRKKFKSR